jgi:hypothetical protein
MREEIERQGGIKLIYIDPPLDVGADFSFDIEIGDDTFTKNPGILVAFCAPRAEAARQTLCGVCACWAGIPGPRARGLAGAPEALMWAAAGKRWRLKREALAAPQKTAAGEALRPGAKGKRGARAKGKERLQAFPFWWARPRNKEKTKKSAPAFFFVARHHAGQTALAFARAPPPPAPGNSPAGQGKGCLVFKRKICYHFRVWF